jgi:hypothetical protein
MGGWSYFFLAVIVSLIVAGYVARFTIDGAGIVGIGVLWFFAIMNPAVLVIAVPAISILYATAAVTILVFAGLYWKQFM